MKISEVRLFRVEGRAPADWPAAEERVAAPLDIYPDFDARAPAGRAPRTLESIYVEVLTDSGPAGVYGPIIREQAFVIGRMLRPFLVGRDPLAGELLWDQMFKLDRHARAGLILMAISAVDNALWDLRGKHCGAPVYRLLGGPTRDALPAYASMLGHALEPARAQERARAVAAQGFTAQKWFFRHGPGAGPAGLAKNLALARALREALGDGSALMFDAWMSWDVEYATAMARALAPLQPTWLEEPLPPYALDGYRRLKQAAPLSLAAGEHLYTRWEFKPYLDAGVLSCLQPDPDWTGGISELVKTCALAAPYGVQVVPHGCTISAAAHVVLAQPPALCPRVEYLLQWLERQQFFHLHPLKPEHGQISLPTQPGLGLALDEAKIELREELKW